jgi:8-oxo-dGTP pyrophosphatase MutT (NUDIX family)
LALESKAKTKRPTAAKAATERVPKRKLPRHRQYGAIPVRFGSRDQLEVLLLTSRGTGRWVIPKGWPMPSRTPAGTARREAYEEAGVKGWLWSQKPIGSFRYVKREADFNGEILVRVFVLFVDQQKKNWPEKGQRRVRWLGLRQAASLVKERELAKLLLGMPRLLVGRKAAPPAKKKARKKK